MLSSDTIISLGIGLGGLAVAILSTWVRYLSLKAMKTSHGLGAAANNISKKNIMLMFISYQYTKIPS